MTEESKMMICKAEHVQKMMGGNIIIDDLNIEVKEGDRIGIVGRNGSGKTTLLKLIARVEKVDQGSIMYKKGVKIGYLAQIPQFDHDMTGYEVLEGAVEDILSIQKELQQYEKQMETSSPDTLEKIMTVYGQLQEQFIQLDGYNISASINKIIQGLQLQNFVQQPFMSLSGGEQTKLMLGKLLLSAPDLLLLDEPTNHLDVHAIDWIENYLNNYKGAVVIVSHDRYFLDKVAKSIADMEDGELHMYTGNYSNFLIEKEAGMLREFQQYEEQQKKIKKMREAIKRLRQWANEANPPSAGLHKQARNMERALERLVKIQKPNLNPKKIGLAFETNERSGKDVLILDNVSKGFDQPLFENVDLQLQWKQRMAIVGGNGTGKSTLFRMILGEMPPDSGACKIGSNVKIGYLSQKFEFKNPQKKLIDTFRDEISVTEGEARSILAKFLFYGFDVFKKVSDLSGGERMRLRLAQFMHQDINFLLLDEPTNHLDIESREVLEEALIEFEGTILAISHDRYFLNKIFDATAWLENNTIEVFTGPFDWANEKKKEQIEVATEIFPVIKQETKRSEEPVDIIEFEVEISNLEAEIEAIKEMVREEENWERYESLLDQQNAMEVQLEKLLEQWIDA